MFFNSKNYYSEVVKKLIKTRLTETFGIKIGDLNFRLPGGRLTAKVLELSSKGNLKTHPGEEFLFCLTGTVGVEISNVKALLNKGDAIFFWGTEPHCYFNADENKDKSVALSIICGDT